MAPEDSNDSRLEAVRSGRSLLYGPRRSSNVFKDPDRVEPDGTLKWLDAEGRLHRGGDLPAKIDPDGGRVWYRHGQRHRDGDKPAAVCANGHKEWYQHGELHREGDKPAVICADGERQWWRHDQMWREGDRPTLESPQGAQQWMRCSGPGEDAHPHRDDDQPAIIHADGAKEWWKDGQVWRRDGLPTMETPEGDKYWTRRSDVRQEPVYHRDGDLPAIIFADGHKEYWRNGEQYVPE